VPGAKDQLWYGDITYIFTMSGWAYLETYAKPCYY
jgi:transposase InsO family protein